MSVLRRIRGDEGCSARGGGIDHGDQVRRGLREAQERGVGLAQAGDPPLEHLELAVLVLGPDAQAGEPVDLGLGLLDLELGGAELLRHECLDLPALAG